MQAQQKDLLLNILFIKQSEAHNFKENSSTKRLKFSSCKIEIKKPKNGFKQLTFQILCCKFLMDFFLILIYLKVEIKDLQLWKSI